MIRSCQADAFIHSSAQYQLFTGRVIPGFPEHGFVGAVRLGSESDSLPGYVVIPDPYGTIEAGQPVYSNAFPPPCISRAYFAPARNRFSIWNCRLVSIWTSAGKRWRLCVSSTKPAWRLTMTNFPHA